MENEDIINKIDVTYLWGDQEPCFYYACKLAQEAYVNEEYRVFKASFEERRFWAQKHFWEDYAGEECLLLLGLSVNDIVIEDLESLLSGRRFRNVQLGNVKKIIITAHCDPMEFEFCVQEEWDSAELGFAMGRINQEYELRDSDRKRIAEVFAVSRNSRYEITEKEQVDTFSFPDSPLINHRGYFEKFDFNRYLRDSCEHGDTFHQRAGQLPIHEQRKLCAALEMTAYGNHSIEEATAILDDLDSYIFYPDILTNKDYGYYAVYECDLYCVPTHMRWYFNFELLGHSLLFRVGGYEGISEYGYITRPFTVKDMDRIRAKAKEYPKCLSNNIPECPLEIADDFVLPF